jgi:hypothetical protein
LILDIDPAASQHLTYDMFEAYVDGRVDDVDREIVDTHIVDCGECSYELNELLKLRDRGLESITSPTRSAEPGRMQTLDLPRWLIFAIPAAAAVLIAIIVWSMLPWQPVERIEIAEVPQSSNAPTPAIHTGELGNSAVNSNTDENANDGPSKPVLTLIDGSGKIEIDVNGNLTGLKDPGMESAVRAALKDQSIEVSAIAKQLRPKSQVLMGNSSPGVPFALTGPVGKVVETDRPHFTWRPLNEAESYTVAVFDAAFNKVAESPPLQQTMWTPSAKLKRGTIYQWQVTAVKGGEEIKSPVMPAPEAKFKVIDGASANQLAAAKRSGGSHLVLGILYANAGILDDAEREFQALAKQNPNSTVVRKLLQIIRSYR